MLIQARNTEASAKLHSFTGSSDQSTLSHTVKPGESLGIIAAYEVSKIPNPKNVSPVPLAVNAPLN